MTDTATDFESALDESPDDFELMAVYADWLEERGDDLAAAYRWCVENRKRPAKNARYKKLGPSFGDGEFFWHRKCDWWDSEPEMQIPIQLVESIKGRLATFTEHPTRRAAMAELAKALKETES